MKSTKASFDITAFSSYKSIKDQYTNDFIKNNKTVVVSNDENKLVIAKSDKSKLGDNYFNSLHKNKNVSFLKIKDRDFSEFIGSCVELGCKGQINTKNRIADFNLESISSDAPIVNIINAICLEAIRKNCSDIHIQNTKDHIKIRLRIDGVLQTVKTLEGSLTDSLVNRIKVMSGLNVMENRLCQDGRMTVSSDGQVYDFRVSIVPCITGQSIVLRLFNIKNKNLTLEDLGFSAANYKKLDKALKLSNGMILATGPTGSGKTTTLHALISKMDKEHLKIVTIEDPVEKEIEGVDQIQVNNEIGLTFESILRRLLRQDPDVIMVGEIRDKETAQLAVRAALTGHLILSTLHTNDSAGAFFRLRNLGIENYLVADVLRMSLAQRLVRKVCPYCKGKGCDECSNTGFKGRTCVSEIIECDDEIREMVERGCTETELRTLLKKKSFKTLQQDALQQLKKGITTREELITEGLYES